MNLIKEIKTYGLKLGIGLWRMRRKRELCAICGRDIRAGYIKDYFGGIDDKEIKKTHYVCMQCYDWFYLKSRVIRNSVICKS